MGRFAAVIAGVVMGAGVGARVLVWGWVMVGGMMLTGCRVGSEQRHDFARVRMGVEARVSVYSADREGALEAASIAFDEIARLEQVFSDYRPSSDLSRLAASPAGDLVEVPPDLFEILALAREIHDRTGGAFDPTVGPLVDLWRASRREGRLPDRTALDAARARTGVRFLELIPPAHARVLRDDLRLDLGGIAKGYAAQRAVDVLRARGYPIAMVALAGDVVASGPPPGEPGWRIALEPTPPGLAPMTILLAHAAVSTSGDAEQFVEIEGARYAHLIDPATGLGSTARRTVTVVAPRGEWADAAASALAVTPDPHAAATALIDRFGLGVVRTEPSPGGVFVRVVLDPRSVVRGVR
ncbi:MAG: FAD:protein FMN transferase [Phycisphaeraceae bacterium]|nr:MAG: FAD:protein FMN transferase [Phycisphaeraceae bacterium]